MPIVPVISVEQAQALLPEVLLKLQTYQVRYNPVYQLELETQKSYLEAIISGTYTPETWPNPPLFH